MIHIERTITEKYTFPMKVFRRKLGIGVGRLTAEIKDPSRNNETTKIPLVRWENSAIVVILENTWHTYGAKRNR